jgi:hypothetical protein
MSFDQINIANEEAAEDFFADEARNQFHAAIDKILEEDYSYDLNSEIWTDETIAIKQEVISATVKHIRDEMEVLRSSHQSNVKTSVFSKGYIKAMKSILSFIKYI